MIFTRLDFVLKWNLKIPGKVRLGSVGPGAVGDWLYANLNELSSPDLDATGYRRWFHDNDKTLVLVVPGF